MRRLRWIGLAALTLQLGCAGPCRGARCGAQTTDPGPCFTEQVDESAHLTFDPGSAAVDGDDRAAAGEVARHALERRRSRVWVRVCPQSSADGNDELRTQRSEVAMELLLAAGLPRERTGLAENPYCSGESVHFTIHARRARSGHDVSECPD
jgi:hypothetical protein